MLLLAVFIIPACKVDCDSCPREIGIPFESVDIPDSIEAGETLTLDAVLYDYGCYEETNFYGSIFGDSVFLEASAVMNECDCPKNSIGLQNTKLFKLDSTHRDYVVKFFYTEVFANGDSVRPTCHEVVVY